VAEGAARQAAWALLGGDDPPAIAPAELARYEADFEQGVVEQFQGHAVQAGLLAVSNGG
jgi:hypothetical protein